MWKRKDLLGLEGLSREEIETVLERAARLKGILSEPEKKRPVLRGRSVLTLFFEASTRTRTSFEMAGKFLAADITSITPATSSQTKGETLLDTARNLEVMGFDAVVVRHQTAGVPQFLATRLDAHVLNAGDGMHEHPTQGLLDLLTIRERKGRLDGLQVAILGDIAHSRVARSDIWGLLTMGATVRAAGPATLLPADLRAFGAQAFTQPEAALEGADVVIVLRLQLERQQKGLFPTAHEYAHFWGLSPERLRLARPDALVMHPGPINRGLEVPSVVADGPQSVILEQVKNGVAVRMACLTLLLGVDA
ncbi:MAG: aspartate carbamoyltransferase catalytic subunit [Symbiobacteriia bacterium]